MKKHVAGLLIAALIPGCAIAAKFQAFQPGGPTVLISATTTAASTALPGSGASLLIYNSCSVPIRVNISGNAATTPGVGTPGSPGIPATTLALIEITSSVTSVSVKVDSGSACNVELTRGDGQAH